MSEFLVHIKSVLFDFNGILVKKDDYLVDDELRSMKNDFLSDMEMDHVSTDKNNLHRDIRNVANDLKKSFKKYKEQKETV